MVKIIVGMMGSSVAGGSSQLSTTQGVTSYLSTISSHRIHELDTARVYASGKSEELLGAVSASNTFAISTKAPAFAPQSLTAANIISNCNKSLQALNQPQVDIYYLHGPDRATPLEEQCRAIAQLYTEGKFRRFGVSNISADEVQRIHDICTRESYPLPAVYQGGFNPIGRSAEAKLIPLCRKLGMAFYAFSPLAGGLLAKKLDDILHPAEGSRYQAMKVFGDIYLKENFLTALEMVREVCRKEGISVMEATLRWFMHHSVLGERDGVVLGASTTEQIEESLSACEKGKLPEEVVRAWERLWEDVKEDVMRMHG